MLSLEHPFGVIRFWEYELQVGIFPSAKKDKTLGGKEEFGLTYGS